MPRFELSTHPAIGDTIWMPERSGVTVVEFLAGLAAGEYGATDEQIESAIDGSVK